MKSYSEYDDDSIIVNEGTPEAMVENPVAQILNDVLLDRAKFNQSYAAASAQSKRLNSIPGAQLQIRI